MIETCLRFSFWLLILCSCRSTDPLGRYELEVYETSESGKSFRLTTAYDDTTGTGRVASLTIDVSQEYQEIIGFGASFTESSAWNLATISKADRAQILKRLFDPHSGAGFSLCRTHINSCDYSNNHYTYVEDGDTSLSSFSIFEDKRGFSGLENEQVKNIQLIDATYDLIPMILEARSVTGAEFRIIASPWSPPSWMKEGETAPMTNGKLLKENYAI